MNGKTQTILIILSAYILFLAFNYERTWALIEQGNFTGYVFYFLSQLQYILIIYFIFKTSTKNVLTKIIASILIILSIEFISYPHCVQKNSLEGGVVVCSDYFIVRYIDKFIPHKITWYLYYIILPIIMLGTAAVL
ncbi:MAG: hypothetical protein QXU20_05065, partial [Candidatus Woesearchaeota archaeon]